MIPKRAVGALVTTVFALALLFSFKTADDLTLSGIGTAGFAAVGTPPSTAGGVASTSGSTAATPAPTTAATSSGTYHDGTDLGSVVATRFGNVQVQVTISGGQITDVTAVQLPNRDGRSQWIASEAEPILREEALTAQSANIDLLSGATYTSEGYAESLQSALDKALA
jgi:uncharacterized protein with FMN-binding domain